jgi:hypothetical protein
VLLIFPLPLSRQRCCDVRLVPFLH